MTDTTFRDWYDVNADRYNAERRARYKKDKDYKKRVQAYTRRYRDENPRRVKAYDGSIMLIINHKPTKCWRTGKVAERIGCSTEAIRYLEKQGYIPKAYSTGGRVRAYTDRQIELVLEAFEKRALVRAGELEADWAKASIAKEWAK